MTPPPQPTSASSPPTPSRTAVKTETNCSPEMKSYFNTIKSDVSIIYEIAREARSRLLDPTDHVEVPLAEDVCARVEGLVSTLIPALLGSGLAQRLRELEAESGKGSEMVAFKAAREVFENKFVEFNTIEERIEGGLRVGLAYMTLGIVTAPLEGISRVKIKKRTDGSDYLAVYFSGPIRSAGGTANAFAVLIADYLRKLAGLRPYDPTDTEVQRYTGEVDDYDTRVTNLQYRIRAEEVAFITSRLPVEITGEPTEKIEVLSFKDLPRIETNRIRGGMCLTISMIGLKAAKLYSRIKSFGEELNLVEDWAWFDEYLKLQKTLHKERESSTMADSSSAAAGQFEVWGGKKSRVMPNTTFLEEIPGGRPVFAYPSAAGGFRLRYGRARNTGFAAVGVHPATMAVLGDFIAVGTQLRLERPGKAGAASPVDSILGPTVLLDSGEVLNVESEKQAHEISGRIKRILFVGDILIGFGEFVQNGKDPVMAGYCEELWATQLSKAVSSFDEGHENENAIEKAAAFAGIPSLRLREFLDTNQRAATTIEEAVLICEKLKVPLHPRFTYFYSDIPAQQLLSAAEMISKPLYLDVIPGTKITTRLELANDPKLKETLELLCVPHKLVNGKITLEDGHAHALRLSLGLTSIDDFQDAIKRMQAQTEIHETLDSGLDLVRLLSPVQVEDKAGTYIGSRLGRPEKAERRLLKGRPQSLFPVGFAGGRMRSVNEAAKNNYPMDLSHRTCISCGKRSIFIKCDSCGGKTVQNAVCPKCGKVFDPSHKSCLNSKCGAPTNQYDSYSIDFLQAYLEDISRRFNEPTPDLIKGVRGLVSDCKIPERLEKGFLRAKHNLFVNKDGTVRFDLTDSPLTHFTPKEVKVTVAKLRKLGYTHDSEGKPLEREDQLLELKIQDILISDYIDKSGKLTSGGDYLLRIAQFIDDLLAKFYGLKPFYNLKSKEDLVGHYVVGLAPHTSAGVVGRIIGFTNARVGYAHPVFHSAKKRNCDGDEDSVMLLLDALINFSRNFLSTSRGSSTMDAPLVLTTTLDPSEVDDEVRNLDVSESYPAEFYEYASKMERPQALKKKIQLLGARIKDNTPDQFENMHFTHRTSDIQAGPLVTAYKSLGPMLEKVDTQLRLGRSIRAVNADDVAATIVSTHFLKDIKGNIRTFCAQTFRCSSCNEIHRRIPLSGRCRKCGGANVVLTVHQGTIEKYLIPSIKICEEYDVPPYLKQELRILQKRVEAMFGKEKQSQLDSFLSKGAA